MRHFGGAGPRRVFRSEVSQPGSDLQPRMGIHFYNIGRRAARVAGAVDALHSHEGRDSHLHGVARSKMFEGASGESDGVGKRGTAGPRGGIGVANPGFNSEDGGAGRGGIS